MICPLYLLAKSNPKDPYLILNDHHVSFLDLHSQVMSCEHLFEIFLQMRPLAIDSSEFMSYYHGYMLPLERVTGSRSHLQKIPLHIAIASFNISLSIRNPCNGHCLHHA